MSDIILSVKDLKVNYGGIEAVKGISFDVPAGKIVTLIGANGAGKSTTLKAIAGLVKPSGGDIAFSGESIVGKDSSDIVARGVTVLLIEQNANMALKTADFAYVLETGRITMSGTGAELLTNEEVKKAYLGK